VAFEVVFAPEAQQDILQIYEYVAEQAGAARAQNFADRVISYCEGLTTFPERGTRRDDLGPGLRVIGYRRRVTIAFHVEAGRVTIDRLLYGGRDLPSAIGRG
jgi:toxin ParE1/3/4